MPSDSHRSVHTSPTTPSVSRRDFLRRSLALSALAVAGPPVLAACGGGSEGSSGGSTAQGLLAKVRDQGYATIGFANENPYGFEDKSGKLTGEAPEVARAIMKRLGVDQIKGKLVDFGALIPGLKAKRYDFIAAGMFINPKRCAAILFTDPDYCALEALGVKSGNPKDLSDYTSVASSGAKLAVETGAVELDYAKAAGVPDSHLVKLDTPQALVQAVEAGRADAFSLTSITVNTLVKNAGGKLEMATPFVPVVNGKKQFGCGGYGFRTSDQDFRDAFNTELHKMQQNNEILPIISDFGFTKENVQLAEQHTADELCKG